MFEYPWVLVLLGLVPLLIWRQFRSRKPAALQFSSTQFANSLSPSLRQRLMWLPGALSILGITLLILGIARPREGTQRVVSEKDALAIELVVDRSGSMQAMDFDVDGKPVDRLTAVKKVASDFVTGGDELDGRSADLLGLISFAGFADGRAPLTLDHRYLVSQLMRLDIVNNRAEDGTAIGDAIALAVEKLSSLDERRKTKMKSKLVILLTDGENTAGQIEPLQAAEIAQTLGIKIYTIGVGTQGRAPFPVTDVFGERHLRYFDVNIDEDTLTKIAELTGGKYFRATDTDSLKAIYREIDQLEKTQVEVRSFVNYRELAVQSWRVSGLRVPPVLLAAWICLWARVVLQQTWLREVI